MGFPRRLPHIKEFAVNDELVLVSSQRSADLLDAGPANRAVALSRSGRAIWALCDGRRSTDDLVDALGTQYTVDPELLSRDVHDTLLKLSRLGFLDDVGPVSARPPITFVIGIEDRPYFWWQVAVFLESLNGKLPAGWRTMVVVCNNNEPVSADLGRILTRYGVEVAKSVNHANRHPLDIGRGGGECYAPLNRVEALSVASKHADDEEVICLLDSDVFLYKDLNIEIMPVRCAAPWNWHIAQDIFLSSAEKNDGKGINLAKLLAAVGCETPFKPGGVNIFVTGRVAKDKKYLADCYRFAQALFLLGRIAGAESVWMAEMPCFTLAMTVNNIQYDLLERKELLVSDCDEQTITPGTLYHYYSDPSEFGRFAFHGSRWFKQAYFEKDFLRSDFEQFAAEAMTDHERYFFRLACAARRRIYD